MKAQKLSGPKRLFTAAKQTKNTSCLAEKIKRPGSLVS